MQHNVARVVLADELRILDEEADEARHEEADGLRAAAEADAAAVRAQARREAEAAAANERSDVHRPDSQLPLDARMQRLENLVHELSRMNQPFSTEHDVQHDSVTRRLEDVERRVKEQADEIRRLTLHTESTRPEADAAVCAVSARLHGAAHHHDEAATATTPAAPRHQRRRTILKEMLETADKADLANLYSWAIEESLAYPLSLATVVRVVFVFALSTVQVIFAYGFYDASRLLSHQRAFPAYRDTVDMSLMYPVSLIGSWIKIPWINFLSAVVSLVLLALLMKKDTEGTACDGPGTDGRGIEFGGDVHHRATLDGDRPTRTRRFVLVTGTLLTTCPMEALLLPRSKHDKRPPHPRPVPFWLMQTLLSFLLMMAWCCRALLLPVCARSRSSATHLINTSHASRRQPAPPGIASEQILGGLGTAQAFAGSNNAQDIVLNSVASNWLQGFERRDQLYCARGRGGQERALLSLCVTSVPGRLSSPADTNGCARVATRQQSASCVYLGAASNLARACRLAVLCQARAVSLLPRSAFECVQVYELDDVLYQTLLPEKVRQDYEQRPPLPTSPLSSFVPNGQMVVTACAQSPHGATDRRRAATACEGPRQPLRARVHDVVLRFSANVARCVLDAQTRGSLLWWTSALRSTHTTCKPSTHPSTGIITTVRVRACLECREMAPPRSLGCQGRAQRSPTPASLSQSGRTVLHTAGR
jgi:hypothetical protein